MTKILTIPSKLELAIQKNNLVIFVGAGCSMPLGLPSWKKLIEDILQDLDSKYGETSDTNFKNILNGVKTNSKSLFDALSKIENDSDNGSTFKRKSQEFINSLVEEVSKSLPEESKVHTLLWEISSKIITTNYDKILEQHIPKSISPKIFDNSNAFQGLKSQTNDSEFLYKIHGDYDDPKSIILFESDYRNIYKNSNFNADTLANHFKEKNLLFIGFSLSDPFVNDLFLKIKDIYEGYSIKDHFIFTTKNEDFIKYGVTPIKIQNWEDDLLNHLLELKKIKLEIEIKKEHLAIIEEKTADKELTKDDVNNIVELITKKTNELLSNPSDKELAKEIKNLRVKLDKLLFGNVDYLQEVDKPFRDTDLQILFETIYSSEDLNAQTLEQIQKIRNNSDKYKWYDRSVIVSALCCSLIHFNKADEKKITLLIDFINDNEEKVWQKSIVSLFLVLNHLGNKWLRFPSIKTKIKSLNQNSRIQDACSIIIRLFSIGLNNVSMVDEKLFNNPYFSESVFNYFLPYHQEDNVTFNMIFDTYEGGDIEKFIEVLNEVPIPDQIKYLICSSPRTKEEPNNKKKKKTSKNLKKILQLNSIFYPYSVYVQEIISFYKFFPIIKHEEKLKSQLKLTETPLRDYLLNEKQKYSGLGSYFMQENNWSQAIVNFKESIKLDENDIFNLLNLANCYHNNKEFTDELKIRIKIKDKESKHESNLHHLFNIYFEIKKEINSAIEIANQLVQIDSENAEYFYIRSICSLELNILQNSLDDIIKAIEIDPKEAKYYSNRSNIYFKQKEYDKAILDLNAAIKIDEKDHEYYFNRSTVYHELKEFKKANDDIDIAIKIDGKNSDYLIARASNNMYLSLFDKALIDLKKAESLEERKDVIYNCYCNYYRLQNNFEKAFEYIEKASNLYKDFRYTGTKATIYASMNDDEKFYQLLEQSFVEGAEADLLYIDIKEKYRNEPRFINLLKKYNQL